MDQIKKNSILVYEEIKALKFFLLTFYIILLPYDFIYYYLIPHFNNQKSGLPDGGMGFFFHLFLFALLPVAIILVKKGHPEKVKYIYFIVFFFLDVINNILIYWGTDKQFNSGHVLEIYFILFSPMFVNKRFFWTMTIGFFVKYLVMGLIFQSPVVLIAMGLIIFISAIAFILLTRFQSYLKAIISVHEDLRQKEKLAVIGQMATAIAHEIKNPLSSLKGFTQLQQEKDKSDEQYYSIMLNEIDRINDIVNDLLVLGKPNTGKKDEVKISSIIAYVLSIMEAYAKRRNIYFNVDLDDSSGIFCDENQMKQVFINIIKNAMEAMPEGGNITIISESFDEETAIFVKDEGIGITQDIVEKIGEPFFTTKENGTGLGLMVTKRIILEHDGIFTLTSEVGEGTTVSIKLPKVKDVTNI